VPTITPTHPVATSSSTFTTSTTSTTMLCGGVARCLDHTQCAQCLEAINSTADFPHSLAEFNSLGLTANRAYNIWFFQALQTTASCSTETTPPGILQPALQELDDVDLCVDTYGMAVSYCILAEYACFADPNCRQCLAAVIAAATDADDANTSNGTKAAALRSPACTVLTATNPALLNTLINVCGGSSFPVCTFYKQQCASMPDCASCLATLDSGDGAETARQCPGSTQPSSLALDNVVKECISSNTAACDFWRQRCADNAICSACLAVMSNGDSLGAAASDWSTPACQRAAQDVFASDYLQAITIGCPGISACRRTVVDCVATYGNDCTACINGSAAPSQVTFCSQLSEENSFDTACQPCAASVHTINAVVFATAAVGGASAASCLAVAATIVAHGHDCVSMRDRIVVGLMMANAVYSTANAIPLNALRTDMLDCGRLAMSFDAIRFGRAWWFCGKYGLVGFELFILGASIRAMRRGFTTAMPRCTEVSMHAACCALAVFAFAVFYTLCARINANGYNGSTEPDAYTNALNHAHANDDLDDLTPWFAASSTFESQRDAYDNLVRDMLMAWDCVVGVAVAMWIVLRALHWHALRARIPRRWQQRWPRKPTIGPTRGGVCGKRDAVT
jgi:hypothetical protein